MANLTIEQETIKAKIIDMLEKEQKLNRKNYRMYKKNGNETYARDTRLVIGYTDALIKEISFIEND